MNEIPTGCRDEALRWVLSEPEDSVRYQTAAEHIQTCALCQRRLSEMAADRDTWVEAQHLLNGDATIEALDREWRERSTSGIGLATQAPVISETLIRQFLGPPSHPEMLGRLGRYEIERWIGSGGMGIVVKGFDTELNRPVAIKLLAPHLAANGAARQRFAREARAAAAVVHEHVVAIHNVETDGTLPLLVMQYVAGESLQTRLDREGPLEAAEILRIARQTALGLAAAHAQGLVHRDVKPSNILLEKGVERTLLTDFGLARASDDASLTHTGYLPGTPHYMSPEQARGESIDARSDLFSLGSVMYAMATGRPPFRADTSFGVLRRITDTQPRPIREVNPRTPDWLAALIDRLLAKQPDDRWDSAAALATVLEACLAHVQQPEHVPLPGAVIQSRNIWQQHSARQSAESPRGTSAPRTVYVRLGGVTLMLTLVVLVAWYFRPPHPTAEPAPAAESTLEMPAHWQWQAGDTDVQQITAEITDLAESYEPLWQFERTDSRREELQP